VRRGVISRPYWRLPRHPARPWLLRRLQSRLFGEPVATTPAPSGSELRQRIFECATANDVAIYGLMAQIELTGWSKAEVAATVLYVAQRRVRELLARGLEVPLIIP